MAGREGQPRDAPRLARPSTQRMNAAPLTLRGQRIELAPMTIDHLDALWEIGLAPELWSATTIRVESRADMRAYIGHALELQAAGTAAPFVIVDRIRDSIIGTTRFHGLAPE